MRDALARAAGSIWLRIAVTAGLLAAVASGVDWSQMSDRVRDGRPVAFALAVLCVVAALIVGALRWQRLLEAADVHVRTPDLARICAISAFGQTFLPTSFGGDLARALLVVRRGPVLTRVGVSILADRVAAFLGLLGVAWLALAVDSGAAPSNTTRSLVLVTLLTVVGGVGALWVALRGRAVRRLVPERLRTAATSSRAVLRRYVADRGMIVAVAVLSLLYQAIIALSIYALAESVGISLPYTTAALLLTLTTVAQTIPISIAGFGVREASFVVILAPSHISSTDATLLSLLTVAALFVAAIPGAVLLARRGMEPVLEASAT